MNTTLWFVICKSPIGPSLLCVLVLGLGWSVASPGRFGCVRSLVSFSGVQGVLPTVAASVVGLPGCSLSAFFFPFRADPGCCQGRGCVCSLLFLVASPSFSCVCVWCAVVHQTRNAFQTLPPLRRSLLCLLCRLLLFSPPPFASCYLPHPCCYCCPSFVVFGSFPVVLLLGWVGHPFIFMVILFNA